MVMTDTEMNLARQRPYAMEVTLTDLVQSATCRGPQTQNQHTAKFTEATRLRVYDPRARGFIEPLNNGHLLCVIFRGHLLPYAKEPEKPRLQFACSLHLPFAVNGDLWRCCSCNADAGALSCESYRMVQKSLLFP